VLHRRDPSLRVRASGLVLGADGAPLRNATVEICANDSSGGSFARARTCERTTTDASGHYEVTCGSFVPDGSEGLVRVVGAGAVLDEVRFASPRGRAQSSVVAVDLSLARQRAMADVVVGPVGVPFGFFVCAPRELHDCVAAVGVRGTVLGWPRAGVLPSTACDTLVAETIARCGDPLSRPMQPCFAAAGVFLDAYTSRSTTASARESSFVIRCLEGEASVDFPPPL
jgi:hypothetical protein